MSAGNGNSCKKCTNIDQSPVINDKIFSYITFNKLLLSWSSVKFCVHLTIEFTQLKELMYLRLTIPLVFLGVYFAQIQ